MILIQLIVGLVFLIIGAELLVRGASKLASAVGISPLVIGLTVVAFGTSAPEMTVSVMSSLTGEGDVALGNVVGSNIFNVLFILGISAIITPLVVSIQLIRFDVPLMIAVSVLVLIFCLDGQIGRIDGGLLFTGIILYTGFLIFQSRKNKETLEQPDSNITTTISSKNSAKQWMINISFIIIGLALLVYGSKWLVDSAITIAQSFGISELIIGLTIIAAGTSLPEVATSIMASIRGERDIAVGNVVGSNIFNILAVLGLSSLVSPDGIQVAQSALHFDIPIMIAVAIACLPIFFTGHVIARWEGALFFGYYVVYTLFLVLNATQHELLIPFNYAMIYFIIPLTLITLIIGIYRSSTKKNI